MIWKSPRSRRRCSSTRPSRSSGWSPCQPRKLKYRIDLFGDGFSQYPALSLSLSSPSTPDILAFCYGSWTCSGLLQAAFASFYSDLNIYNAEDINVPNNPDNGFYPKISDYSLPFTLSNIWKKKADILGPKAMQQLELLEKVEQMKKYNGTLVGGPDAIDRYSTPSPPSPKSSSPRSSGGARSGGSAANGGKKKPGSPVHVQQQARDDKKKLVKKSSNDPTNDSGVVQDYENSIRNDNWPLQCIKCVVTVDSLEGFNIHMNDHWSEDKCCPVCGLLINSKRFNFKQHLKIHTGEKPFVCSICSRSFRQKAHMVKHISIHRTVPDSLKQELIRGNGMKMDQMVA